MERVAGFNKKVFENGVTDPQPVTIDKVDPSLRILRL